MSAADFHARQHALAMGDMSFTERRMNDQSWFAAVCARGAELVQAATRSTPDEQPTTTAEVGAAFQPAEPTRAETKAAKLAKAKAVLYRAKMVSERTLSVQCPRHQTGTVAVEIEYGYDGWSLKVVPSGCDVEDHAWTPGERAALADRVDVAFGNWTTNQEEAGAE